MEIRKLVTARWFATAFAVLALTLAACSGDKESTDGSSVQPDSQDKQVLRLRLQGEPKTIDPHLSNQATETTITRPLFAGLFTYNDKLDVIPNLATESQLRATSGAISSGFTHVMCMPSSIHA